MKQIIKPSKVTMNQGRLVNGLSVRVFEWEKRYGAVGQYIRQPEVRCTYPVKAQPQKRTSGRGIVGQYGLRFGMAWLVGLLASTTTLAQSARAGFPAKNTLLVELGGKGTVYSVNYDRIIRQKGGLAWSLRAGAMFLPESKVFGSSLFVPLSLNAITGRKNHHLELSLGQTLRFYPAYTVNGQYVRPNADYPLTFIGAGYRYQKPGGGRFFSATLLPSFRPFQGVDGLRVDFMPWLGVGIGQSF